MDTNFDLLEKYILHQLDDVTRQNVEKRIQSDPEFAKEYTSLKIILGGIQYNHLNAKKKVLQDVEKNIRSKGSGGPVFTLFSAGKLLLAACLVTVLFWIGYKAIQPDNLSSPQPGLAGGNNSGEQKVKEIPVPSNNKSSDSLNKNKPGESENKKNNSLESLVKTYSKAAFATLIVRSESTDSLYNKAVVLYNTGDFKNVLATLESPEDTKSMYLKAHALFKMKAYAKAAELFRIVSGDEYAEDQKEAKWYLFLSLVMNLPENEKEARTLVKELQKDKNSSNNRELQNVTRALGW